MYIICDPIWPNSVLGNFGSYIHLIQLALEDKSDRPFPKAF